MYSVRRDWAPWGCSSETIIFDVSLFDEIRRTSAGQSKADDLRWQLIKSTSMCKLSTPRIIESWHIGWSRCGSWLILLNRSWENPSFGIMGGGGETRRLHSRHSHRIIIRIGAHPWCTSSVFWTEETPKAAHLSWRSDLTPERNTSPAIDH